MEGGEGEGEGLEEGRGKREGEGGGEEEGETEGVGDPDPVGESVAAAATRALLGVTVGDRDVLPVLLAVAPGDMEGVGVAVKEGVGEGEGEGEEEGVERGGVGLPLTLVVPLGVEDVEASRDTVTGGVEVGLPVGLPEGDCEGVGIGVMEGDGVGLPEGDWEEVGLGVGEAAHPIKRSRWFPLSVTYTAPVPLCTDTPRGPLKREAPPKPSKYPMAPPLFPPAKVDTYPFKTILTALLPLSATIMAPLLGSMATPWGALRLAVASGPSISPLEGPTKAISVVTTPPGRVTQRRALLARSATTAAVREGGMAMAVGKLNWAAVPAPSVNPVVLYCPASTLPHPPLAMDTRTCASRSTTTSIPPTPTPTATGPRNCRVAWELPRAIPPMVPAYVVKCPAGFTLRIRLFP